MLRTDADAPETILRLGNVVIDEASFRVYIGGEEVHLTRLEFDLLIELATRPDRILSPEHLCSSLWGQSGVRERRRLSVIIFRLREKLRGASPYAIQTTRRRGYGLLVSKRDPP